MHSVRFPKLGVTITEAQTSHRFPVNPSRFAPFHTCRRLYLKGKRREKERARGGRGARGTTPMATTKPGELHHAGVERSKEEDTKELLSGATPLTTPCRTEPPRASATSSRHSCAVSLLRLHDLSPTGERHHLARTRYPTATGHGR
jgi:hypothetical protein